MKTIQLTRMELQNFKGVAQATYEFSSQTNICGGNGTGKSTIYEAYLWCLFDKNQSGNSPKVQPLDENNEVRHKLTTSVRLHLTIDGNPLIVERTLKENWVKPRGTAELVCKGTTSEYAINEVPLTLSQYNQKLTEIMPLDRWFLISSIGIIPNMEQKACRAALQAIAPAIDERAIAAKYPAVLKALNDGLTIEELQATVKQGKKQAQANLDGIPAALEAQDRLRVNDNFDLLDNSIKSIDEEIAAKQAEIDKAQKQTIDEADVQRANKRRADLNKTMQMIAEYEQRANAAYNKHYNDITSELDKVSTEAEQIACRIKSGKAQATIIEKDINIYRSQISNLREQWKAKFAEEYQEPTINGVCPTCGQPLPEFHLFAARNKAREEWNARKAAALTQIQRDAESAKARIDQLAKENDEMKAKNEADAARLPLLQAQANELTARRAKLLTAEQILANDEEYQKALRAKAEIEERIATEAVAKQPNLNSVRIDALKGEIAEITELRDQLLKRLAGRDTNERIDAERARLENEQSDLANLIAEYEGKEAQIQAYRKAKITAVEEGVSSLFTMVHWKMYEPNLTNDGEKEICQAIINGIPYEQQNSATRVNAGIDICNGFAQAYGVSVPLIIDNAESVTETLPTNGQSIKLTVVAGSELKIY